jgi:type II secretory pathway component GspD/PulD (secretin)
MIVMRIALYQAAVLGGLALTTTAAAQAPRRPAREPYWTSSSYLMARQGARVSASTFTSINIQTTVTVPDGGTASLGGYSSSAQGRTELGAPVVGRLPGISRGFRNIGYGSSARSTRASVRVRIIDLREEEYRQTGFRSR